MLNTGKLNELQVVVKSAPKTETNGTTQNEEPFSEDMLKLVQEKQKGKLGSQNKLSLNDDLTIPYLERFGLNLRHIERVRWKLCTGRERQTEQRRIRLQVC